MEKRLHFLLRRNGVQHGAFAGGEEFRGDLVRFGDKPDAFDVNSQCGLPGPRDQRQTVRVRQVEVKRWRDGGSVQQRLAAGFVGESHASRFDVQVTAQDHPEQPVADDEPVAIAVELKPVRPFAFALGQRSGKCRQIGGQLVQPGAPDMNFVASHVRVRGWGRPA